MSPGECFIAALLALIASDLAATQYLKIVLDIMAVALFVAAVIAARERS